MDLLHHTVIYEVDFPSVACQKATLVKRTEELSALVEDTGAEGLGMELWKMLWILHEWKKKKKKASAFKN